jgi:hypothetical protein
VSGGRPSGGRLAFERAIRYSSLPAPARHLALTIATWADIETGVIPERFQPSLSTLAEATGMGVSTVKRQLTVLEVEGWTARDRPEQDRARREHARTQYLLQIPAEHGPERAMPRPRKSQAHGPERAKARPTAGHKSSCSTGEYQPPSPPPPPKPEPDPDPPTDGREGGRIAAPDEQRRPALDALLRITATDPRLTIGEREALELLPLVVPWLERTTTEALREALTAGLPVKVGSAVGLLRTRLTAKLPPQRASPEPASSGLPPWCEKCGDEDPAAKFNTRLRRLNGAPCPNCHPDTAAA